MGYEVYSSVSDCSTFDFIVSKDGELFKVEVKSTNTVREGRYTITLKSTRSNKTQNKIYNFDRTKTDFLAIYLEPEDKVVIMKSSEVTQVSQITLYHANYVGGK